MTERLRAVLIHFVVGFHVLFIGALYRPVSGTNAGTVFSIILGSSNWPMQLYVLMAGYAAFFNFRSRGLVGYVKERMARLVVPLVFGCVILNPPIVYIYLLINDEDDFTHSFSGFWSKVVEIYRECFAGDSSACLPYYGLLHMWFVFEVFVFGTLCIPLFVIWRSRKPPSLSPRKANIMVALDMFLILPISFLGLDILWSTILPGDGVTISLGNNLILYVFVYLRGYVLAWSKDLADAVLRFRWFCLLISMVSGYAVARIAVAYQIINFFSVALSYSVWWQFVIFEIFRLSTMYWVWGFTPSLLHVPSFIARYLDYIAFRVIAIYILNFGLRFAVLVLITNTIYQVLAFDVFAFFIIDYALTFGLSLALFEIVFNHKYVQGLVGMWRL